MAIAPSPEAPAGAALVELRSTAAVRARASGLLARARRGESAWFIVNDGAMDTAAALVAQITKARYPGLHIPYHSRWRHFETGGIDRTGQLDAELELRQASAAERARAEIDLAVVSVLLDAGAGADWGYVEPPTGGCPAPHRYTRSEGLAVASFHAFMAGLFSSSTDDPYRADAEGLKAITTGALAQAFQVTGSNSLVGLEGRADLLRQLGAALESSPDMFGRPARPGHLFDWLTRDSATASGVQAGDVLNAVLTGFSGIWPARNVLHGHALGDCWLHLAVSGSGDANDPTLGWMPFHKLPQWMTYSLLEPFEWAGIPVLGLDTLTGLPDYRNGGLFLDVGVLRLRNPALALQSHQAGDELIVEWRALTVALLDELAPLVREQLGLTAIQMPLTCVLEGGTWAAGRALAQQLRGGQPPLNVESDGTVF